MMCSSKPPVECALKPILPVVDSLVGAPVVQGGEPSWLGARDGAIARRMLADWNQAPSDRPDAVLVCDRADMKAWKRPCDLGNIDAYESEVELPVRPETFLAMLCDTTERVMWDETTKDLRVIRTYGTCEHHVIHRQAADEMTLFWLVDTPWPLANREYVLERKLATLDAATGTYVKLDVADDEPGSRTLWPQALPKTVRVCDYWNVQVIWAGAGGRTTCFRSLVREHPMTSMLPKWLMSWMIDKMMPRSLAAFRETAIQYEKRVDELARLGGRDRKEGSAM